MTRSDDILGVINGDDLKDAIKTGYLIIGPNSSDGTLWRWHASSEAEAVRMTSLWAERSGCTYEIFKYEFIGVVRSQKYPVEFVKPPQSTTEND